MCNSVFKSVCRDLLCPLHRAFFKGGVTEGGGFHTRVRGTMFVRDGAVTPGPSRKCDITFFVKGRPKSARQLRDSTVAARRVQSVTVPSSRVSRECRSPGLRSPPLKMPDSSALWGRFGDLTRMRPGLQAKGFKAHRWTGEELLGYLRISLLRPQVAQNPQFSRKPSVAPKSPRNSH